MQKVLKEHEYRNMVRGLENVEPDFNKEAKMACLERSQNALATIVMAIIYECLGVALETKDPHKVLEDLESKYDAN